MAYKPAIDGLRAVAVLAVIAYHAGLPVPAGFVGVDVFFVISGYLITGLLYREIQLHGRIDYIGFYARRARRILPAMTVVIMVSLAASVLMLSPEDAAQAGKTGMASFLFAANVYFVNASSGYFDISADNPLLHLWSLGVEEQFYLVWPLVLMLTRKRPLAWLAVIATISLVACQWLLTHGNSQAAFYLMPTRAWELAAGGLIAVTQIQLPRWVGWVGMATTIAALTWLPERFPGIGAMPAVFGAGLIIAAVHADQRNPALETRPMRYIGRVSYSLYLWHWPVMLFGSGVPIWMQIVATFGLATLSYHYVETPLRRHSAWSAKRIVTAGALLTIAGASASATIQPLQLGQTPFPPSGAPLIYKMGCDGWYKTAEVKPCRFGSSNARHTAVIIGDSVAMQWYPAVYKIFDRPNWNLVVLVKSGCPMVNASIHYDRIDRVYSECAQWRKSALLMIVDLRPDVVIVGSSNSYPFSEREWRSGTAEVLQQLAAASSAVRLLRATPLLALGSEERFDNVANWQATEAGRIPNAAVVDMNDVVCPTSCRRTALGRQKFMDDRHLEMDYAATLYETLQSRLDLPNLDTLPKEKKQ